MIWIVGTVGLFHLRFAPPMLGFLCVAGFLAAVLYPKFRSEKSECMRLDQGLKEEPIARRIKKNTAPHYNADLNHTIHKSRQIKAGVLKPRQSNRRMPARSAVTPVSNPMHSSPSSTS